MLLAACRCHEVGRLSPWRWLRATDLWSVFREAGLSLGWLISVSVLLFGQCKWICILWDFCLCSLSVLLCSNLKVGGTNGWDWDTSELLFLDDKWDTLFFPNIWNTKTSVYIKKKILAFEVKNYSSVAWV